MKPYHLNFLIYRWLSHRDFLETFNHNYELYLKIRDENPRLFSDKERRILDNRQIKEAAVHMLQQLDIVSQILNVMQSDSSNLSDAMKWWLMLSNSPVLSEDLKSEVKKKMDKAVTPHHILAKMVSTTGGGIDLPVEMKQTAIEFVGRINVQFPAILAAFEVEDNSVFPASAFNASIRNVMDPINYWRHVKKNTLMEPFKRFCDMAVRLLSCPPSSAGLERTFSAFGLIHSKLRNRLSNERVMKLVRVYCHLRDTEGTDLDNFLQVQMAEDIQE